MNYPSYPDDAYECNPESVEAFRALSLRRPPEVLLIKDPTCRGILITNSDAPRAGEIWFPVSDGYDRLDHTILLRTNRTATEWYVDPECLTIPERVDLSDAEAVNRWLG